MVRLLQWLIFGHVHKWKLIDRVKRFRHANIAIQERPTGEDFICQCEHCGKIRAFET